MFGHFKFHRDTAATGDHQRRFARMDEPWERPGFEHRRHGYGHGPGGRGPGGRGGRMFDHGQLRLVILKLIAEKPSHGYELIKAIEDKLGGEYSPSPGVIYPALTLLEELGHATVASSDGGRKLYTVTEAGQAFLDGNKPAVDAAMARMNDAGAARSRSFAPQILRAMENLKTALRLRLSEGALRPDEIAAIAAALDKAALAVESTPATPRKTQIEEGN